MSFRAWGYAAAFGLAALSETEAQDAIPSPTESPAIQQGAEETEGNDSATPHEFSIPVRIIEDPVEADRMETRENQAAERERRDLAAQESVARSTEQIVLISWWQLGLAATGNLVAVVGTIFLVYNLVLTKRATNAAIAAASAAHEANRVTKAQARPWVALRRDVECVFSDYGHAGSLRFGYAFENVGKSPAFNIRLEVALWKSNWPSGPIELWPVFIENCRKRAKQPSSVAVPVLHPSEKMKFRFGDLEKPKATSTEEIWGATEFRSMGINSAPSSQLLTASTTALARRLLLKVAC